MLVVLMFDIVALVVVVIVFVLFIFLTGYVAMNYGLHWLSFVWQGRHYVSAYDLHPFSYFQG
jgi:hypothetical protein